MTKQYLWLITQDTITAWSTYVSAVVVAESAITAKRVLPTGKMLSGSGTWCTPEHVSVCYLGIAEPGLEGVICVSTASTPNENNEGESA